MKAKVCEGGRKVISRIAERVWEIGGVRESRFYLGYTGEYDLMDDGGLMIPRTSERCVRLDEGRAFPATHQLARANCRTVESNSGLENNRVGFTQLRFLLKPPLNRQFGYTVSKRYTNDSSLRFLAAIDTGCPAVLQLSSGLRNGHRNLPHLYVNLMSCLTTSPGRNEDVLSNISSQPITINMDFRLAREKCLQSLF